MEENKHVVSMKEMTLLIQEIGKGLIQLRNDRKGLRQEINKYEGRDSEEAQKEVKQLEEELLQVNGEIDEKEQEIRTVQEIALAKLNIDEKISDAESEHIKMTNEYEKQKQELLRQRQEQKMTLITETETGLNSLRTSREQLNNELENYRNKNFEQGIKELEGDLVKIDEEIGLKEQKLNSLQAGEFQQEEIDAKLSEIEQNYHSHLIDNENTMSGLLGQRKNNNDMAEDLMKKYNIREISELSEVDETLSTSDNKEIIIDNKLGDVSDKKKSPQDVMWSILSEWSKDGKIDIPSKKEESQPQEEVLEPELTEQEPVTQAPIVVPEAREQKPEERTEPKTTMPEDIEEQEQEIVQEEQINNEVPANMRNRLNSVRLTFESGRPEYEILYNDENGELQFEIISDVEPRSMTDKEKQVYKQSIEPKHKRDLLGVDVGIIVALHELDEKNGGTSQLGHQYLYYLKDLISNNKERGENDIDIIYDLSNIKKSNLSLGERLSISRIAAKSERLGTAEYIPAPNKIRDFFRNFRQKKLPSGNFEKVGHYAIDDFANYEGFDMDTFIEQQESVQGRRLTQEEKDRLMDTYYDAKERNAWKEELKVDTEPLPQQEQTQNNEPQEKEEETR